MALLDSPLGARFVCCLLLVACQASSDAPAQGEASVADDADAAESLLIKNQQLREAQRKFLTLSVKEQERIRRLDSDVGGTRSDQTWPAQIYSSPTGRHSLWYKMDTVFKLPRAMVFTRCTSPLMNHTPHTYMLLQMFVTILNLVLTPKTYAAELAGLSIEMEVNLNNIVIKVGGYNDKLSKLVNLVFDSIVNYEWDEKAFVVAKESLVQKL